MPNRGRQLVFVLLWLALVAVLTFTFVELDLFSPRPVDIVEVLEHPRSVAGWTEHGLTLSDGSILPLPGIGELPSESIPLAQATQHGVEVDPNGRVIGLVRLHHWCGNDPVRLHLVRVDLAHLLMYFEEGNVDPPRVLPDYPDALRTYVLFSEYGWDLSQFSEFVWWSHKLTGSSR